MANEPNERKSTTPSRGRPRKQPESVKTRYLGFRLPEEEIRTIEVAATAAGESVSEYVRNAITFRMKERKQVIPAASLTYAISPFRIDDNKLPMLEGTSIINVPTEVKPFVMRAKLTEDESSYKEE